MAPPSYDLHAVGTEGVIPEPQLRPGQSTLAFYTAENTSDRVITGVSTYNVTPQQAGTYFNKIQCFCFEVRCSASLLLVGPQTARIVLHRYTSLLCRALR